MEARMKIRVEVGGEVKVCMVKGSLLVPAWYFSMVLADSEVNFLITCLRTKPLKNMGPFSHR
jgi:hypothetical protein